MQVIKILRCFAVFALTACASLMAMAAEFKVDVIQFEPWAYRVSKVGTTELYAGVLIEYIREFERRSGHKVIVTLTPYARVELNLKTGATDFSLMVWSNMRAAYARRGTNIMPLRFGVRLVKGAAARTHEDLHGLRMGVPRGLKLGERFDADPLIEKQMTLDYTQAIRMAVKGHGVSGVVGSLSTIDYLIRKLHFENFFGDELYLNVLHGVVVFSLQSKNIALEAEVNAIFEAIVQDGTAEKIYKENILNGAPKENSQ
ncbi:substrate-binding periplasmic protein [Roseateles albus]|uniref:Transporter substrate-binding domain-containing protein n=1 Tax=Roseateles albus TaxID=2987525 RepID=A0ABT5KI48_9BURK|nr:transporter substrate-binding domain-containing protein [Roseateles albus]MDC8773541.1 transporter substrate-binding domain-containing protein [Roseateles albus]